MQAPLKLNNKKRKRGGILFRTFRRIERLTTLAGFKEFLKDRARELLYEKGFKTTIRGILLYAVYVFVMIGQLTVVALFLLSVFANFAGSATPMLATLLDSDLTFDEKIKTITGFTDKIEVEKEEINNIVLQCSSPSLHWRSDLNTYVNDNELFLKEGKSAGTIILKEPVSSFLGFEITVASSMQSGINTIISFKNSGGNLKYAIGDGDFKTIRYSYTDKNGVMLVQETTKLENSIHNEREIGFKLTMIEKANSTLSSAVLSYYDIYGRLHNVDLENIQIPDPKQLYQSIVLGIDAGLETQRQDSSIKLLGCSIIQTEPSKLLNI